MMTESSKYSINSEVVQIIETNRGMIVGKQVQSSLTEQQTQAAEAVAQLWKQLQQKYPNASDAAIIDRLAQGFQAMPQHNPQKWQHWQDLLSVLFAGGFETVKVLHPAIGIPLEVLKRLYEIYNRNQKQLPGRD